MLMYKFRAKDKRAELLIYDTVGGGFWDDGVTAKQIKKDLDAAGDISGIDVRINSYGGYVHEGVAIYNLLKSHPAAVNVTIDGVAASIASVIAMAGEKIVMAQNSEMMIHNAWTVAMGSASDLRKEADHLEQVNEIIRDTYGARAKVTAEEITAMMDAETWMTAKVAVEKGFATEVSDNFAAAACSFDAFAAKAAEKGFKFRNAPVERLKKLAVKQEPAASTAAPALSYHDRIALARQEARKGL